MITYDEIEQLSRAKAFKPGSKEYHAVRDFIEYRQRYQRGLTDPIYGLQALDELQRRVDQAVNPPIALAGKLAVLQQSVRSVRKDYRDHDNSFKMEIDTRLNQIEAKIGTMISEARGELQ